MKPRQRRNEFNIRDARCFPQHAHCLLSGPGDENILPSNKQNHIFVEDDRILNRSSTVNLQSSAPGMFFHLTLMQQLMKLKPARAEESVTPANPIMSGDSAKVKVISAGMCLNYFGLPGKRRNPLPHLLCCSKRACFPLRSSLTSNCTKSSFTLHACGAG